MISDLTHKLSLDIQIQLINRDKPTDLFEYAEQCRRVYQRLKKIARSEAFERSTEQSVIIAPTPTQKVGTRSTIRTARSNRHPVTSERDQLMKEGRCFSCREVGHRTIDCPSERKLTSKLSVSRMTMQKSEQKESRTKAPASQAEVPHAEKPHAGEPHADEKPLIVSSSSLPGDFFAEEALVVPCLLGNNDEIKTTALLDTGATGYSFVDPAMARRICDYLLLEPIRLSKPKAIRGFDGKRAPDVTHAIYPTMTVQEHGETITPMLITRLDQHQIIFGKPWMKKHGVILDMRNDRLSFWPGHCQHTKKAHVKKLHAKEPNVEAPHAEEQRAEPGAEKPRVEEPHAVLPVKILKRPTNEVPEPLLPCILLNTRSVSKVANTPEAIKPQEKKPSTIALKPKPNAKDEAKVEDKKKPSVERADSKPLDLVFIGGAPFMRLAKSKKPKQRAEIFAISMRDIEYQLNKTTKPPTDPKTVVPAEYHDFLDVFSKDISDTLRPHRKHDHKIELLKDKDLASDLGHSALRGMSTPQLEFVKKFLEEHLKKGFIEASSAPCSSPILLAKKPDGGIRFCVDYRKLNSLTKKDAYPLPLIAETIARLKKAIVFTKIDIRQAFHKLRMAMESEDATTFASRFGSYKWKVMPFGLTGGPASWQRFINDLLWEYLNNFCTAYLDDILIYSTSMKEHRQHVRKVLTKLREAGIQADVDKCEFHVTETKYLGLIISTEGIKMDPPKVDAIKQWDSPTCVREVRSFIGFCNFYRRFIKDFSKVAGPLNTLTKKDVKFAWTDECELAFQGLKQRVCEAPILKHFDPSKQCHVETDSSDYVSAGVLSQEDNGILHPVAYFSRRIVPAECNYEIYDKELLAIIRCFKE